MAQKWTELPNFFDRRFERPRRTFVSGAEGRKEEKRRKKNRKHRDRSRRRKTIHNRRVNLRRKPWYREMLLKPCHYCGGEADTGDHKVPISRSGTSDPENLVPACFACNNEKGDMTMEEYLEFRDKNAAAGRKS